jgi:hypothetical protein
MTGEEAVHDVAEVAVNLDEMRESRQLMDKSPERLRLTCLDPEADHSTMVAEARRGTGDARLVADVVLPLALSQGRADAVAQYLLGGMAEGVSAEVSGGLQLAAFEPGDRIRLGGAEDIWRIEAITDRGAARHMFLMADAPALGRRRASEPGRAPEAAPVYAGADLAVIDAPAPAGNSGGPLVAAFADPWPDVVAIFAGPSSDTLSVRLQVETPAIIARLAAPVGAGAAGRWDHGDGLTALAPAGAFSSLPEEVVLAGGNSALLETEDGWELVQFRTAELVAAETWRLTGLLRGQGGSPSAPAPEGARLVLLDGAVQAAALAAVETGMDLLWRAGDGDVQAHRFDALATRPWQPCQLRVRDGSASWIRRGADIPDSWTFPDAPNTGRFAVEFDSGEGFGGRIETDSPTCAVPVGTLALRVAEIGPDGRTSPWLSIGAGSPYL